MGTDEKRTGTAKNAKKQDLFKKRKLKTLSNQQLRKIGFDMRSDNIYLIKLDNQ